MDIAQYVEWSSQGSNTSGTKIYFYMKTKTNLFLLNFIDFLNIYQHHVNSTLFTWDLLEI